MEDSVVPDSAVIHALIASCRADLLSTGIEPQACEDSAAAFHVASLHGLSGLFYRQFLSFRDDSSREFEAVRSAALAEVSRSYRMADELVELQGLFRSQSIEMVAFKGPVLSSRVYPRLSDRSFADLDILIRPADLTRAAELLTASGYTIRQEDEALAGLLNLSHQYHASFARDNGTVVELHWAFNAVRDETLLDTEGMLRRAMAIPVLGAPVMSLTVEDTILHLCVHGFRHRWSQLKWLADIAYLLRGPEPVDWTALEWEARQVECYRMVLLGLGLAHDVLGATLPQPVLRGIKNDKIVRKLVLIHWTAILQDRPLTNREDMLCVMHAREGFREHVKASWGVLSRVFRLTAEDLPPGASLWMKTKAVFSRPARLYREFGWKWVRDVFELR